MSEINGYGDEEQYGELLPNWTLVRLVNKTNTHPYLVNGIEMTEGSWGLTQSNDPDFIFSMDPLPDPCPDDDDECNDEEWWNTYLPVFKHYDERLAGSLHVCYLLGKAAKEAKEAGWEEDGGLSAFILQKVWECLEKSEWKPSKVITKV